jgi:dTDP-glucose 4,6-dehydratase
MAKVIITGGAGFIFSHVAEYLREKGYDVIILDNMTKGSHPEILDGFSFHKVGVHHEFAKHIIVEHNPEYIIHAAAYSDVDGSIRSSEDIVRANCDATLNVFEAAKHCPNLKKLVYISTDEVYGECLHRKTENEILFPRNPYSFSKAHGSLLRLAYDNTFAELKDKTAETRFCNVVGERQDPRKILPRIREALRTGDPVPVHNGGTGYREYIWVENIPPAVELVMLKGNRTYNVTNNEGFTVKDLILYAEDITGQKVPTVPGERPGMDEMYQMHASRIHNLGWKPTTLFDEGLRKYLV